MSFIEIRVLQCIPGCSHSPPASASQGLCQQGCTTMPGFTVLTGIEALLSACACWQYKGPWMRSRMLLGWMRAAPAAASGAAVLGSQGCESGRILQPCCPDRMARDLHQWMRSYWLGLLSLLPRSADSGWPFFWDTVPPTGEAKSPRDSYNCSPVGTKPLCYLSACIESVSPLPALV